MVETLALAAGAKAVSELSFVLQPATGKVVVKNATSSNLDLKTYDEADTFQAVSYANYTVAPGSDMYIQARGKTFIHCWVVDNGTMYTPNLGSRYVWDGRTLIEK